jgi:hypothetical protein
MGRTFPEHLALCCPILGITGNSVYTNKKSQHGRNSQWCSYRVGLLYSVPLDLAELRSIKSSSNPTNIAFLAFSCQYQIFGVAHFMCRTGLLGVGYLPSSATTFIASSCVPIRPEDEHALQCQAHQMKDWRCG